MSKALRYIESLQKFKALGWKSTRSKRHAWDSSPFATVANYLIDGMPVINVYGGGMDIGCVTLEAKELLDLGKWAISILEEEDIDG